MRERRQRTEWERESRKKEEREEKRKRDVSPCGTVRDSGVYFFNI